MNGNEKVFVLNPKEFFTSVVKEAFDHRRVSTFPLAQSYLIDLLQFFISADNLFVEEPVEGGKRQETLAELFLKANNSENIQLKIELLKRLGDMSLYVSGFFGDSLQKKIVDIDYYVEMGCRAYMTLATTTKEDMARSVYREYSRRFPEFVEVLTHISQKVLIQNDENLLRLYDRYLRTGSRLAYEHLIEKGIIPTPDKKVVRQ